MSIWLSGEWSTPEYQAAKKLNFDLLDAELTNPPTSILDIGCGAGRFAQIALDSGANVVALDYSNSVDACYTNLLKHANLYFSCILNLSKKVSLKSLE